MMPCSSVGQSIEIPTKGCLQSQTSPRNRLHLTFKILFIFKAFGSAGLKSMGDVARHLGRVLSALARLDRDLTNHVPDGFASHTGTLA